MQFAEPTRFGLCADNIVSHISYEGSAGTQTVVS
jgi:hypothetical protein